MENRVHLYQMTCWESTPNHWHINDVKNLSGRSAKWYTPMRILELSIEDYIDLLINIFNAKNLKYVSSTDYLAFDFLTEREAKKFCAYVNKEAKLKKYYCA